jgi:hypothetical protein
VWWPANISEIEPWIAIIVFDGHEHVEHVAVGLVRGRVGQPLVHDFLHQRNEFDARLIA